MAWNRPSEGAAKPTPKKPSAWRGVVAGLVVVAVALGAVCYFMIGGSQETPRNKADKERGRIKQVKTAVAPVNAASAAKSQQSKIANPQNAEEAAAESASTVTVAAESKAESKPKRKPIFKNGTDQLIYLAVFASNGASIPPLPRMTSDDTQRYIDSLRSPIEIEEDDPPQVREMKKSVNEVRQQIADIIVREPDRELSEILNAHRDDFNGRLNLRAEAQKAYDDLVKEGDEEGAAAYLEKANKFLTDYGIDPIEREANDEDPAN